ncbi:DUF998 domain-containing protein [Marinactinospora rubrisoli]|uniref:DUF998 domain-containing protein n=1 Tax=Marinactinospora rubrisoli TaxID=2715399 RepID=A0ABW2KMP9_9ACTN
MPETDEAGTHRTPWTTRIGAVVWLLGAAQFLMAHLVVQAAWPRPYSWSDNNVSDLGVVGCSDWGGRYMCSPLHDVMNASFVLQGVALVAGTVLVRTLWRRGALASLGAGVLLAAAGVGWIVVGLAPADVHPPAHSGGALLVAVGNLGLVLAGLGLRGSALRAMAPVALVLGVVGVAATVLFLAKTYLGLGMGGMERFWIFPAQIWTLAAGCGLLSGRPGAALTSARRGPRPGAGRARHGS